MVYGKAVNSHNAPKRESSPNIKPLQGINADTGAFVTYKGGAYYETPKQEDVKADSKDKRGEEPVRWVESTPVKPIAVSVGYGGKSSFYQSMQEAVGKTLYKASYDATFVNQGATQEKEEE